MKNMNIAVLRLDGDCVIELANGTNINICVYGSRVVVHHGNRATRIDSEVTMACINHHSKSESIKNLSGDELKSLLPDCTRFYFDLDGKIVSVSFEPNAVNL